MQLNKLRDDMRFNLELLTLIETLKNIAASQYHLLEKEKERFDRFMDAFADFFRVVDLVDVRNPLVKVSSETLGVVIVTSDSGFMGGLNQGVIRAALGAARGMPEERVSLVVVGEKGAGVLSDGRRTFEFFPGIAEGEIYERAMAVKEYIVREVMEQRMGRVLIAYPRPLSFSAQTVEVIGMLPCGELFDRDAESEVSRRTRSARMIADARRVIVESSFSDMAEYLAGVWVASKLYEVFEDSKLAELSARAMHLEGSCEKLQTEQKKLKHRFVKAAHEKIDKGMRESFAATKTKRDRGARAA